MAIKNIHLHVDESVWCDHAQSADILGMRKTVEGALGLVNYLDALIAKANPSEALVSKLRVAVALRDYKTVLELIVDAQDAQDQKKGGE